MSFGQNYKRSFFIIIGHLVDPPPALGLGFSAWHTLGDGTNDAVVLLAEVCFLSRSLRAHTDESRSGSLMSDGLASQRYIRSIQDSDFLVLSSQNKESCTLSVQTLCW
jgi:hypothetical protein